MICKEKACLKDLYDCRCLNNDQVGGTLLCKGICGGVNDEAFVVYVTAMDATNIHPSGQAQIALNVQEVSLMDTAKYLEYTNVSSLDCTAELPKHIRHQ